MRSTPSSPFVPVRRRTSLLVTICVTWAAVAEAQTPARHYADFTLEELMNEIVTSASKRAQRLSDTAAAIYVLSHEDIQRSGATHVADTLRMVPGMQVSSANASQWAVSPRGFNVTNANKLLVLIDGRPVYTPLFSGVYWDIQQPMLEDLDRIEVIRGPGATLWGANAVNGVINITSREARDTQGGLVYGGGGDYLDSFGGARYGGRLGDNTYYRVFATGQSRDRHPTAGTSYDDSWDSRHAGYRLDHYSGESTHLTWQADYTAADLEAGVSDVYNVNTIARLSHDLSPDSAVEVQVFYDRTHRNDAPRSISTIDTYDVEFQHTLLIGDRHITVWGLGYRHIITEALPSGPLTIGRNRHLEQHLYSAFAQHEYALVPDRLFITGGAKFEHNDVTGVEVQPSLRALFKPTPNQTLWSAVSRSVRTPGQWESQDLLAYVVAPPILTPGGAFVPILTGNGDPESEVVHTVELGYRIQASPRLKFDLATFFNHYEGLLTYGPVTRWVPGAPFGYAEIPVLNGPRAQTYGGELLADYAATESVHLRAGFGMILVDLEVPAGFVSTDPLKAPRHQATLGAAWDVTRRFQIDAQARYVDRIYQTPAYLTADLRLAYRPLENLEVALVGRNLLEPSHPEAAGILGGTVNEVPRSVHAKVTWHF